MPHCTVTLAEESLDGSIEAPLIEALTDAIASVYGDWARTLVVVELLGIPRGRVGVGGTPANGAAPVVTLTSRERLFEVVDDAATRLVAGLTDALAAVLGDDVRPRVVVTLVGVPNGRSGVGGEVAT